MNNPRSPNGRSQEQRRGYRLIADVVTLTRYCAGYLRDLQDANDGWTVYYAVDADIVGMHLAPIRKAEYGSVFHEQKDEAALLTRLIGDFIFKELKNAAATQTETSLPLLMMQPHDRELSHMLFALSRKIGTAMKRANQIVDTDSELLKQLHAGDATSAAQWLIDHAPDLIELFDGESGPRQEIDRFNKLEPKRLLNLKTYSAQEGWSALLPRLDGTSEDLDQFTDDVEDWKSLLKESKSKRQRPDSLARDAFALAMLEWINKQFARQQLKRKLVLVTGTQAILKASLKRTIKQANGEERSFAEQYVRHPQAFMADPAFFAGVSPSFGLMKWLELCFPHVVQRDRGTRIRTVNVGRLDDLHNPRHEDFGAAVEFLHGRQESRSPFSILSEWRDMVGVVSVARRLNRKEKDWPQRAKELIDQLTQHAGSGATVQDLRNEITSHAFASLSTLFLSAEWLGVWAQVETVQEQARGIPMLRFSHEFATAQKYSELVIQSMRSSPSSEVTTGVLHDIAAVYADMAKFDSSNYLSHTIHALAYATKGHWNATRTLCQIAIQTTDRLPKEERGRRRGREAAYLLTIAERRLAHTRADLQSARASLQQAVIRDDDGADQQEDIRFRSEALAIDVAEVNFHCLVDKDLSPDARQFDGIGAKALAILNDLHHEQNPEIRRWVSQQTMTNVLDLALLLSVRDSHLPPPTVATIREFVMRAESWTSKVAADYAIDSISKFIFTAAAACYSESAELRRQRTDELQSLDYPSARPFDEARKTAFRQLVAESRSSIP